MASDSAREPNRPLTRSEIVAFGVVVLVYLAFVAFQARNHRHETVDEIIYLDVGRQIVATGLPYRTFRFAAPTLFFDHTPLYVYWVAALTLLGGPTLTLVRLATLAFGVVTVGGVYWIGRTLRSHAAGLVGAAVLATNPFFATWSWFVHMEIPLCCALVFGLLAMIHRRWLLAGLLIAIAVMLKEIALGFLAVACVYVMLTEGLRATAALVLPSVAAIATWFAYAASIGQTQLTSVFHRWFVSAVGGGDIHDSRFRVGPRAWAETIVQRIVSLTGILAVGATGALVVLDRGSIPRIVIVPAAYIVFAIVSSFFIALKEPRYVIVVIPMLAVSVSLVADWEGLGGSVRNRIEAPRVVS